MKMKESQYSRRSFLSMLGASSAASLVPCSASLAAARKGTQDDGSLLHVASLDASGRGSIHSLLIDNGNPRHLGAIASERPVALAVHPWLPLLYAANDCSSWNHEPRATVEVFVQGTGGRPLRRVARRPLCLSATGPRQLRVSMDGRSLVVAAFGGGAWNAFALDGNGMPLAQASAWKETGRGPVKGEQDMSHPFAIAATARGGLLVASDYGADRLTVLHCGDEGLHMGSRLGLSPGCGPTQLCVVPDSQLLMVATALQPTLRSVQLGGTGSPRLAPLAIEPMQQPATALAVHPNKAIVYAASASGQGVRLASWQIDRKTGGMVRSSTRELFASRATAMTLEADKAIWLATFEGPMRCAIKQDGNLDEGETTLWPVGGTCLDMVETKMWTRI